MPIGVRLARSSRFLIKKIRWKLECSERPSEISHGLAPSRRRQNMLVVDAKRDVNGYLGKRLSTPPWYTAPPPPMHLAAFHSTHQAGYLTFFCYVKMNLQVHFDVAEKGPICLYRYKHIGPLMPSPKYRICPPCDRIELYGRSSPFWERWELRAEQFALKMTAIFDPKCFVVPPSGFFSAAVTLLYSYERKAHRHPEMKIGFNPMLCIMKDPHSKSVPEVFVSVWNQKKPCLCHFF